MPKPYIAGDDAHLLANLTRLEQLNFWRISPNPTDLDLRPLINFANLEGWRRTAFLISVHLQG